VTGLARYRVWGQTESKIRPEHRDRLAVVYVRQSSRQQVLEHTESTRLQYALLDRAVGLGWAPHSAGRRPPVKRQHHLECTTGGASRSGTAGGRH
jgi:hypothetical protein